MAIISITFIILSTVVLTLNTLPYFSHRDGENTDKDYPPFALLEAIYMSWFTFEFLVSIYTLQFMVLQILYYINLLNIFLIRVFYCTWILLQIRLIASPSKVRFIKSPMNVIDLLAILPYYISIALVNSTSVGNLTEVRRIAQFFRIMRILR